MEEASAGKRAGMQGLIKDRREREGDNFFLVAIKRDPVEKRVRVLSGDE